MDAAPPTHRGLAVVTGASAGIGEALAQIARLLPRTLVRRISARTHRPAEAT